MRWKEIKILRRKNATSVTKTWNTLGWSTHLELEISVSPRYFPAPASHSASCDKVLKVGCTMVYAMPKAMHMTYAHAVQRRASLFCRLRSLPSCPACPAGALRRDALHEHDPYNNPNPNWRPDQSSTIMTSHTSSTMSRQMTQYFPRSVSLASNFSDLCTLASLLSVLSTSSSIVSSI